MIKAPALAEEAEFIGFHAYLQACHGRLELARCHWEDAVAAADLASQSQPASRCAALTVLGLVRVRRGEAGATELLEEARRLADQIDELQRIGPVAAARCEHAVLRGDSTAVINIAEPVFAEAVRLGDLYLQAELAYWLRKAGRAVDSPDVDHPFAPLARGDWQTAAQIWKERGCPYHQAIALADSQDPDALLDALPILDSLGATPLARQVRAGLRQLGIPNVPRGPATGARGNPAGLAWLSPLSH